MQKLHRRGFDLGPITTDKNTCPDPIQNWREGKPVLLPGLCLELSKTQSKNIAQTESMVLSILEGSNADDLLYQPPYSERIKGRFVMMGSAFNEGDDQEIEAVMFDALDGDEVVAEDLWMKVSWLSFHDDDASLRFRFSFGIDLAEDVAADPIRQPAAASLASAIFPESVVITGNKLLQEQIESAIGHDEPKFVERIIYFNAPTGGAYLHHDLERGHAGVVYAQLTGQTAWLALPYNQLAVCVRDFLEQETLPSSLTEAQVAELEGLTQDHEQLERALNSFAHDTLIHLINETAEFVQYLIGRGHFRILHAGDVLLLPQKDQHSCCWHSVFCLGEEMGQALSFAIR